MTDASRSPKSTWLAVFAIAFIAQIALALNPGWFSHDELRWALRADVAAPADLPWVSWIDIAASPWRPLTENLWLLLSWTLFDTPVAWHVLWVTIGAALAAVFAALLQRLEATPKVARGAALAFALGPYAVYVHGWVATLADLLWVGLGLALAHALVTMRQQWQRPGGWSAGATVSTGIVAFALTATALLAKETALALPALLALCWALRPRERWIAAASVGSLVAAAIYLALRLPALLAGGDGVDAATAIDIAQAPRHWLAYHLYVPRPTLFEVTAPGNTIGVAQVLAGLLWLGVWTVVTRADRRLGVALVLGGALALAPALPMATLANPYGYAFSAWTVACIALAWPRLKLPARALVWLLVLATVWHGAQVQREMRRAGERQALFHPALVAALETHHGPLRLFAPPDQAWLYRRLTTDVASWHGHAIDGRVRWVGHPEDADLVVAGNGQLAPP